MRPSRDRKPARNVRRRALLVALLCIFPVAAARADVVDGGRYRVSFSAEVRPDLLPRDEPRPISVSMRGEVTPLAGDEAPQLTGFEVAFNRHAHLFTKGLPSCPRERLVALTTEDALRACRRALVGTGHFSAHIDIPEQAPFPARGRALLFSSSFRGRPALLAHVYGSDPVPTTQTLFLRVGHSRRGGLGVTLSATLPEVGEDWGYVTGFDFTLRRSYLFRGRRRSVVSASCPAPAGFTHVPFELARGTFFLGDGSVRHRSMSSTCRVSG